jgi:hypothetical protein
MKQEQALFLQFAGDAYVTSQSVMRLPDGRFRIWYASRKKPPFVNKYFAINTAVGTVLPDNAE